MRGRVGMGAKILQGDVFALLPTLAKGSVDVVVTSPPYWKLRAYLAADHPLKHLELGNEPTVAAYIENQVKVFRLVRDAMSEYATCWLNIGDSYASGEMGRHDLMKGQLRERPKGLAKREIVRVKTGIPAGNLCLIPQR